jgi:hypothetical protein
MGKSEIKGEVVCQGRPWLLIESNLPSRFEMELFPISLHFLLTGGIICGLIPSVMENNTTSFTENETIKRGRGRPTGSNSFEHVQIKHLLSFLSEEASVPVSKLWMRDTLGVIIAARPIQVIKNEQPEETEEKVQFALNTFEE